MHRRDFLQATGVALGAVGFGGLLTACGGDAGGIPGGSPTWNVINASFPEMLAGDAQRFAFGLTTHENEPIEDTGVEVYTRAPGGGDVLGGPYATELHSNGALGLGIYLTHVDAHDHGPMELVAVSGRDFGIATLNVVDPADSQAPAPGQQAVSTRTPTFDDAMDFDAVCTRQPDCPLHDRSLDDLLAESRPLLVMFATPAYCQTAVCGPAVDTFVDLADSRDWGDLGFLHVEIFTDAGVTVADAVRDWGLPSEPWLFAIDGDGTLVERLDGPMIKAELTALAERLA
jgi:hypothetical protein